MALASFLFLLGCTGQPPVVSQPQEVVLGPAQPNVTPSAPALNATPQPPPAPLNITIPTPPLPAPPNITVPTVSTPVNTTSPAIIATTPQPSEGPGIIVQPIVLPEPGVLSGEVNITIRNAAFRPERITVRNGTRVTWINLDAYTHRISGNGFESENLTFNQSFSVVFNRTGVFTYFSVFYPQMKSGEIQVIE